MKNYLVTFIAPDGMGGGIYGSHVLVLAREPKTDRERRDLVEILCMEPNYERLDIQLQGIIELPYQDGHRTTGPYGYRLAYKVIDHSRHVISTEYSTWSRMQPIHYLEDLRDVERRLVGGRRDTYVRLISCSVLSLSSEQL